MPTISMFYGVIIKMNLGEYNFPHFHAKYQSFEAVFDLEGNVIKGFLPKKQQAFVEAWIVIHEDELLANWHLLEKNEEIHTIAPLR